MVTEGFITTTSFSMSMYQRLAMPHCITNLIAYQVEWLGLLRKPHLVCSIGKFLLILNTVYMRADKNYSHLILLLTAARSEVLPHPLKIELRTLYMCCVYVMVLSTSCLLPIPFYYKNTTLHYYTVHWTHCQRKIRAQVPTSSIWLHTSALFWLYQVKFI